MKISPREIRTIVIVVLIAVVALVINYATQPKSVGKGPQVPLETAQQRTDKATAAIQKIKQEDKEIKPRIEEMSYTEPAEELVPQMIHDLQATAKKTGIHLDKIKPLRPGLLPGKNGTRVPLEVHFRTPFQPNAVKFLYYVEDPAGKMVVEKLDISSADAKFKTVDVTAQITVFTRALAKDPGAAGGDTENVKDKNDNS